MFCIAELRDVCGEIPSGHDWLRSKSWRMIVLKSGGDKFGGPMRAVPRVIGCGASLKGCVRMLGDVRSAGVAATYSFLFVLHRGDVGRGSMRGDSEQSYFGCGAILGEAIVLKRGGAKLCGPYRWNASPLCGEAGAAATYSFLMRSTVLRACSFE